MKTHIFTGLFIFISFVESFAQDWQSIGKPSGTVETLYTDSVTDKMYLMGRFKYMDSVQFRGLAKWDGVSFSKMADTSICYCDNYNCCKSAWNMNRVGDKFIFGPLDPWHVFFPSSQMVELKDSAWSPVNGNFLYNNGSEGTPLNWFQIGNELFVVGSFEMVDSIPAVSIASFNGQKWKGYGMTKEWSNNIPTVWSIMMYKGKLIAGGNFIIGPMNDFFTDIAYYEDGKWLPLGGGIKGGLSWVNGMVVYKGELYVYGRFYQTEGNVGNCVMRWDGDKWKDVGGGVCPWDGGQIWEMKVIDDKLYAVGIFDCVSDGLDASKVASWDGEKWCKVGNSYFNNSINSIDSFKGELFVAGGFTKINGEPLPYFVKFIGNLADSPCGSVAIETPVNQQTILQITPNPADEAARIPLPKAIKAVTIWVYNTLGQLVYQKQHQDLPEPAVVLQVGEWGSGVYFVEVSPGDGRVWAGRFMKK